MSLTYTKSELNEMKRYADRAFAQTLAYEGPRQQRIMQHACEALFEKGNTAYMQAMMNLKRTPPTIEEFLDSKEYWRGTYEELWPAARARIIALNPDIMAGATPIHEYLDGGAIGCHAKGTKVLMYDGSTKAVEDVKIGDRLMGPDSEPRTVLNLARGIQAMRRIVPNKGEPFVVNKDHILCLKRTRKTNAKTDNKAGSVVCMTVDAYQASSGTTKMLHKLWRTGVHFAEPSYLRIDPYIMGVWLGDGHSHKAAITTMDYPIMAAWIDEMDRRSIDFREARKPNNKATEYHARGNANSLHADLDHYGLINNKHIPHEYLTASRQQRLQLLAGLVDTDGSLNCGGFEITQKRTSLAEGIAFLARSLGYRVTSRTITAMGHDYTKLFISGDLTDVPVRLKRKRPPVYRSNRSPMMEGFKVENLTEGEYFGFALDGDHLYLTADFMVHHNTAKSFSAMAGQGYQLVVLSCFKSPQRIFNLPFTTPIIFMFQSVSERVTRRVLYEPFRLAFTSMPFVKKYVGYDRYRETGLYLENNIQVVPALASVQAMVGQAIISAILDEVNFMQVVENSAQVAGVEGGVYDQAETTHSTIVRRRRSRFITQGPSPGCLAVLSSLRYKDDFLDRKIKEHEKNPIPTRKAFRSKQFEIQPSEKFVLPRFKILVGTDMYPTRILKKGEKAGVHYPQNAETMMIPGEYEQDFITNPDGALRDVCGVPSGAIKPFITQRHKIIQAMQTWTSNKRLSWVDKQNVELVTDGMPQVVEANLPKNRSEPRFVHIDLSKNKDRCGIAFVRVAGFVNVNRGGHIERLPHYVVEEAISIKPSPSKELDIAEVRNWVMLFKTFYKINIEGVSYDGFNSQESIQAWRKVGVWSDVISMDNDTEAYDLTKGAMYEDRLELPMNELLRIEFTQLEINEKTGKVDHPQKGSKDMSDAVAGAIAGAAMSRDTRTEIDVTDEAGDSVLESGRPKRGTRPSNPARRRRG